MTPDDLVDLVAPYSGIPREGLRNLYGMVSALALPPGAVVQCGVANGGSAALLWGAAGGGRDLWMFDSFEGLPAPGVQDGGRAASKFQHHAIVKDGWLVGDVEKVRQVIRAAGVTDTQAHIVKGWFADTMPEWAGQIGPIALLHLDADWYDSTLDCLTWLYPLLAEGGILILDDYGYWPGCDAACRDYGIDGLLTVTPPCGAWMVKRGTP